MLRNGPPRTSLNFCDRPACYQATKKPPIKETSIEGRFPVYLSCSIQMTELLCQYRAGGKNLITVVDKMR